MRRTRGMQGALSTGVGHTISPLKGDQNIKNIASHKGWAYFCFIISVAEQTLSSRTRTVVSHLCQFHPRVVPPSLVVPAEIPQISATHKHNDGHCLYLFSLTYFARFQIGIPTYLGIYQMVPHSMSFNYMLANPCVGIPTWGLVNICG